VLNGQSSDWEEVLSGVPQGSVLGPPLFTIYIDDIDDIVRFTKILRKFADDTKLGNTVATPDDRGRLQLALTKLCEWARTWGMEFNIKKMQSNAPRAQQHGASILHGRAAAGGDRGGEGHRSERGERTEASLTVPESC
jgi:hypothetical protein